MHAPTTVTPDSFAIRDKCHTVRAGVIFVPDGVGPDETGRLTDSSMADIMHPLV